MASKHHIINPLVQIFIIGTQLFYIKSATLPKFSAMLVFGDSLLDTGNNNYINTLAKANHTPYGISFPHHIPTGRFSDGKLISDMLASTLGIKELVPPFLDPNLPTDELRTGVCFASAGSGYDDMTTVSSNVIPVSKQLDYFKQYLEKLSSAVGQARAKATISNALVFSAAGNNDFLYFYYNPTRWSQFPPGGYQDYVLNRIHGFVEVLYDLGCRNFLITGIPLLLPDQITYNPKLMALLSKLQSTLPGSKFVYADIVTPVAVLIAHPLRYGILVSNYTPCCGGGCTDPSSPVCPNPDQYLWWDLYHPTQAVYKVMAQFLQDNALPQFSK